MAIKRIPTLARRVKRFREAAHLSQQALATQAGLSISVVAQLEQGVKADPRVSTVVALARALGVSVDALLSEEKEPPAPKKQPAPTASEAPAPEVPATRVPAKRKKN